MTTETQIESCIQNSNKVVFMELPVYLQDPMIDIVMNLIPVFGIQNSELHYALKPNPLENSDTKSKHNILAERILTNAIHKIIQPTDPNQSKAIENEAQRLRVNLKKSTAEGHDFLGIFTQVTETTHDWIRVTGIHDKVQITDFVLKRLVEIVATNEPARIALEKVFGTFIQSMENLMHEFRPVGKADLASVHPRRMNNENKVSPKTRGRKINPKEIIAAIIAIGLLVGCENPTESNFVPPTVVPPPTITRSISTPTPPPSVARLPSIPTPNTLSTPTPDARWNKYIDQKILNDVLEPMLKMYGDYAGIDYKTLYGWPLVIGKNVIYGRPINSEIFSSVPGKLTIYDEGWDPNNLPFIMHDAVHADRKGPFPLDISIMQEANRRMRSNSPPPTKVGVLFGFEVSGPYGQVAENQYTSYSNRSEEAIAEAVQLEIYRKNGIIIKAPSGYGLMGEYLLYVNSKHNISTRQMMIDRREGRVLSDYIARITGRKNDLADFTIFSNSLSRLRDSQLISGVHTQADKDRLFQAEYNRMWNLINQLEP